MDLIVLSEEEKLSLLLTAAKTGDTEEFLRVVKACKDINASTGHKFFGRNALHLALIHNHETIVRYLLKRRDLDINHQCRKGNTALHIAAQKDDDEMLKLILTNRRIDFIIKNKDGLTALEVARSSFHLNNAELIEAAYNEFLADLEKENLMQPGFEGAKDTVGRLKLEDKVELNEDKVDKDTILLPREISERKFKTHPTDNANIKRNKLNISHSSHISMNSSRSNASFPTYYMTQKRNKAAKLAKKGKGAANMDEKPANTVECYAESLEELMEFDKKYGLDSTEADILLSAAKRGDVDSVKYLIEKKEFDVNIGGKGRQLNKTALITAVIFDQVEVVEYLLSRKDLNVNKQSSNGSTALHFAAQNDDPEVLGLLLKDQRIDKEIKNKRGLTALDEAVKGNNVENAELLGAKLE